jgi:hypothetical protein
VKNVEKYLRNESDNIIRQKAKNEKGCCYYIYAWIVKYLQPFNNLGL